MPAAHPVPGDPADPDGMPALVQAFCEWMAIRGYSPKTIDRYHVSLALFADWAAERGVTQPRDVTRPIVERYQRWLFHYRQSNGRPLTFRSQTARLVALRQFYRWLARSHRVLVNPTAELELPRVPRWQPRGAMTVAETEDVLAQPCLDSPDGLRDRAVLEVFYSTAIRASELAELHIFDLDAARGTLSVNAGKGGRSRVVPIAERAVAWCEKWLLDGRPALAVPPDDNRLFLNNRGGPLTAKRLTAIARKHLDAAGIVKPGSCHLFRHTCATLMLEGGADIRYIQELLGHAELSTTQLYTHVSIGPLKAVHERCHPGAGHRPPRTPGRPHPATSATTTTTASTVRASTATTGSTAGTAAPPPCSTRSTPTNPTPEHRPHWCR